MKEFFKMFFASVLAMLLTSLVVFLIIISIIVGVAKSVTEKEAKIAKGNILMLDLTTRIHEQGISNSLANINNSAAYQAGLYDIVKTISHAKSDVNIKGIFLKLGPSPNGWGTLQQVRVALEDFKTSKKFIYAYGEDIPQAAYFVASAADSIFLNPVGNLELKGYATVLAFFKGTLDKLDLEPEIFFAGKFKSATEPLRANKMSDPNKEQIIAFQTGLWDQFLGSAAQYMHCDKGEVNRLAMEGAVMFPSDALKYRMVGRLAYWDEVERALKAAAGQANKDNLKFENMDDYATSVKADIRKNDLKVSENRVAILFAEGNIVDGEQNEDIEIASKTFCEQIRKIRDDEKIKAVVMRVNSPGGSALASDVILRELVLLKEKKPLIVSMGDYAASGGYYISSMADSIFVLPNTITGSIGVFAMFFNVDKMFRNKLGITFDEVKNAPYADVPTMHRPLTEKEGLRIQTEVDTTYSIFKNHVATGRHLTPARVDEIAQGRVWTGTDAMRIGLADGLGGIGRALRCAAGMARLKEYKVVTFPEPLDKFGALLKKIKGANATASVVESVAKEEFTEEYEFITQFKTIKNMNGRCMMAMPMVLKVK
jgi:protease IV